MSDFPSSSSEVASASAQTGGRGAAIGRFFTGTGLPAFVITATVVYELFLVAVLFAPPGWGAFGAFATEFKVWCFSYNPRTGGMEWAAAWIMLLEPLFIAVLVIFIWRSNLLVLLRPAGWARHWGSMASGVMVSLLVIWGMIAYAGPDADANELPPFPGDRIRTAITPASFKLEDQYGNPFSLSDAKGGVVMVTGVYAHCSTACPRILAGMKEVVASLPPEALKNLTIAAISLNPQYDTAEIRQAVTEYYGFEYPQFRFLNGDPETVADLTMRMGFAPRLDERTGVIDHTNLFILIDADGRIAYRFTLDDRRQTWLEQAVLDLTREAARLRLEIAGK